MKNIIYNGNKYPNLFYQDDNFIFKFSPMEIKGWDLLKHKNLTFLNTPVAYRKIKKEEKKIFENSNSLIKLEFLKNYSTLSNFDISNMNKIEVLNIIKKILLLIKKMHLNGVIHSDLNPDNIMINNNLDINIIDLDSSIIDEFVSSDNIYVDDNLSLKEKINISINDDKLDIFCLLIYYLINSSFKGNDIRSLNNCNVLVLPNDIKNEINSYLSLKRKFDYTYYFEDIIEELLKIDIEKNTKIKKF